VTDIPHRCTKFRAERRPSPWRPAGALREREIDRVKICTECEALRPGRFRKVIAIEKEAAAPLALPHGHDLRDLARTLSRMFQDRDELRGGSLLRRLGGVRAEADLEQLAAHAPLRLVYRRDAGTWHLHTIRVLDRVELTEIAFPGAAARRAAALADAASELATVSHPEACRISELVAAADASWDDRVIRCLTALARLVDAGDAKPARAFAADVLGHSKALVPLRARLERIVGPLDRLGIRDAGAVVLVGGHGVLRLPDRELDLGGLRYLGIAPQEVEKLVDIDVPAGGVMIVENLTPFHACLDHVIGRQQVLVVWSGGFPSRGVVTFIRKLAAKGCRIRAWCDLDLGGIRITRVLHRITEGSIDPLMMTGNDARTATRPIALSPEQREAMQRDLALHGDAFLANTLRTLLELSVWVEQETMLDRLPGEI
jgi:hypothetical protein